MTDNNDNALTPEPQPYYQQPGYIPPAALPKYAGDKKDAVFALFTYILGYLFCRWVLVAVQGWGTAVFTTVFLASVLAYLRVKSIRMTRASWFWFAVTLLTGWSFALWDDVGIMPLRNVFLFCAAVYWIAASTGVLIAGKTGNLLLLDGINSVLVIPFRNFINQYRAFGAFRSGVEKGRKKALPVILGIVLAIIILFIVTPQLLRADSGGFSRLMKRLVDLFSFDWSTILEFLFYAFLALPTAAYLFGLLSGGVSKRGTDAFKAEKTAKTVGALRITAPVTILTVLGAVCVLYVVFIACQIPYFFSAFTGSRPDGWLSYSEYARQGFFELCRLAAINLALLLAANIFSKKPRSDSAVLKAFNIALALITLLLLLTAFSKMALYIDTFGLTILRILPCVFMVLLAVVCVAVIVLQKVRFSIARVALVTGAVLFTALCLSNADGLIVRYNTDRYLSGSLSGYDGDILYRSGAAGVLPALEIYTSTSDPALKSEIETYLKSEKARIADYTGTFQDTVQTARAWEKLKDMELETRRFAG
jgi:hypothetical protein